MDATEVFEPMIKQMQFLLEQIRARDDEIDRLKRELHDADVALKLQDKDRPPPRYAQSTPDGGVLISDRPYPYLKATPGQA